MGEGEGAGLEKPLETDSGQPQREAEGVGARVEFPSCLCPSLTVCSWGSFHLLGRQVLARP